MHLTKTHPSTHWQPLEAGRVAVPPGTARVRISDGAGQVYRTAAPRRGSVAFTARGVAGVHRVLALDTAGVALAEVQFRLRPRTSVACDCGTYARYHTRVAHNMEQFEEGQIHPVDGTMHRLCVCWLRDHTYTLKALRHYWSDVTSGTELFLQQQRPDGMIWDDIHPNPTRAASWLGEALGAGWFGYSQDMRWIFRRIPIEADVEYIAVESVHHAWKASGDDAWLALQLPRLERAIAYCTTSPLRWSKKTRPGQARLHHGLVGFQAPRTAHRRRWRSSHAE